MGLKSIDKASNMGPAAELFGASMKHCLSYQELADACRRLQTLADSATLAVASHSLIDVDVLFFRFPRAFLLPLCAALCPAHLMLLAMCTGTYCGAIRCYYSYFLVSSACVVGADHLFIE